MTKTPSDKRRERLESDMQTYFAHGGTVRPIPFGVSAQTDDGRLASGEVIAQRLAFAGPRGKGQCR